MSARAVKRLTARRAESIFSCFRRHPAQLTLERARLVWERAEEFDGDRRLYLASLTKSGAELIAAVEQADTAHAAVAEAAVGAQGYATKLLQMAQLMDTVYFRLAMPLCQRADMEELIKAARLKQGDVGERP